MVTVMMPVTRLPGQLNIYDGLPQGMTRHCYAGWYMISLPGPYPTRGYIGSR